MRRRTKSGAQAKVSEQRSVDFTGAARRCEAVWSANRRRASADALHLMPRLAAAWMRWLRGKLFVNDDFGMAVLHRQPVLCSTINRRCAPPSTGAGSEVVSHSDNPGVISDPSHGGPF